LSVSSEWVEQVEGWLQPLADEAAPCGPDLEYDNAFLELTQAAQGKPESQFEAAVPADWRDVRRRCEKLFDASRDLRVAMLWTRAMLRLEGASLTPSLRLLTGLMSNFWEGLHPQPDPDDGDLYARANVLALLVDPDAVLADLREANIISLRGVGEVKVRAVDIVLGNIVARDDETSWTRGQVEQLFADAIAQGASLVSEIADAQAELAALSTLLGERLEHSQVPDLKPLRQTLGAIAGMLPQAGGAGAEGADVAHEGGEASVGTGGGAQALSGRINSRAEALRAIEMVCDYLERAEPTNPAQLLLRRAGRLLGHNFLQLMKELAPDALSEVARIMGVDPSTIEIDG